MSKTHQRLLLISIACAIIGAILSVLARRFYTAGIAAGMAALFLAVLLDDRRHGREK
jgi:uncharacterized MnhB-related membrane protein